MAALRIGLLGASRIAPQAVIAPARSRGDVTIAAVAARDPQRARAYAAEHAIASVSDSYGALVERPDIDLIYIALPPAAHLEWATRAARAGKAVLCEKPFAMDSGEARAMVEAARAAGVVLIEAFHYRFHAVTLRAEALLRQGAIGRLLRAEAYFKVPIAKAPGELRWLRDQGGGALMDLGCYPLHALRTLVGGEPSVVRAAGIFEDGVDVAIEAALAFPDAVEAKLACSMRPERIGCRLTLEGEAGSLSIVNFVAPQMGGRFTLTQGEKVTELDMSGTATYEAQLEHVVQVMAGRAAPLTGGDDAIANMAAIDALYSAAERPATAKAERAP